MPQLTANKIKAYCEKILKVLQDSQKVVAAFQTATTVIDRVTLGGETRDVVKTQSFRDLVLAELK